MKTYIDKNEIAALFFLHYFKYTRYAFKKHKSEEDIAAIHAHRELMRLFGRCHRQEGRVAAKTLISAITSQVSRIAQTLELFEGIVRVSIESQQVPVPVENARRRGSFQGDRNQESFLQNF